MLTWLKTKRGIWTVTIIIVVLFGIWYFGFRNSGTTYQFVTVQKGTIAQVVSVTGNTTPVQSLDLAFESGGTIAAIGAQAGDHVAPGSLIARLDARDLQAQLAQAQASVAAAQAQLASLQAGAQPADIAASEAAAAKAAQDLANMYANIPTTLVSALAKMNDAVRNQLAPLFSSAETANPQLTFSVTDSQTLNNVQAERLLASTELNTWQNELAAITAVTPTSTLEPELQVGAAHVTKINIFLSTASRAIVQESGLSSSTVATYKTDVANAVTEANSASTDVSSLQQNIASQKLTVQQVEAQLALKVAGSTQDQIAAQQAAVAQAQATAQSIQVKIDKASLTSPIAGVVTVQNAKVGQIASPGAVIASVISDSNLEIDASVPETDIGKIAVGDPVGMTFDAFPNETFSGKIFYIDPAETIIQGVVDYKIKASFDTVDPRIKSGLTANLDIKAKEDDNVLILPQFAVLQNDSGTFVEVLQDGSPIQIPVTLGIHDDKGNVEIASGATEGEQVLNIGLK